MIEWSGQFGWAAFFSLVSLLGIAFVAIKGMGIREADFRALSKRFESLEADARALAKRVDALEPEVRSFHKCAEEIADLKRERESFQVAVNAGTSIIRESLADFQRSAAERFATKIEVVALEERANKGMDRIVDQLDRISTRQETMNDLLVKALAERR